MSIIKIYQYLLNRKPNTSEINLYRNKNSREINHYILESSEYKNFMDVTYQTIKKIIVRIFKLDGSNGISQKMLNQMYDLLRNNNYNQSSIINFLQEKKVLLDEKIKKLCKDVFLELDSRNNLKNIRLEYLNRDFIMLDWEIERFLIFSDDFNNFVNYKLSKV